MSRVYYQVEGGAALEFCRKFKATWQETRGKFAAYLESKGGIGYTEMWGFFYGVIFADDAEIPKGFRANKRKTRDGKTIYVPRKNTPDGKALAKEFEQLGRFPHDDTFCKEFGIPEVLEYRKSGESFGSVRMTSGGFKTAQVLWVGESFWIVLPDIDKEIEKHSTGDYEGYVVTPSSWTLPEGLARSTEARYDLAVAQHKVDMEAAA